MKNLEIVFGNSYYHTMKNSRLKINEIHMINALFNVGSLSDIKNYKNYYT